MCAIFGSSDASFFKELYKINANRGNAAYGMVFIGKNSPAYVFKGAGYSSTLDNSINHRSDFTYFTGHTQAPTSSAQKYNINTSHPFTCGCLLYTSDAADE